jgi:hypothetical protein
MITMANEMKTYCQPGSVTVAGWELAIAESIEAR